MGGREVGGLSNMLPGYRSVEDPQHRAKVERHWAVPFGSIAPKPGLAALEQFEALAQGKLKAIWILCTNPAASAPDIDLIEKALRQAELVVVQDAYHPTATSRFAHVILPAAQWSEKEGVMTNSERRVTYMPKLGRAARRSAAGLANHFARVRHGNGIRRHFAVSVGGRNLRRIRRADQEGTLCDYLRRRVTRGSKAVAGAVAVSKIQTDKKWRGCMKTGASRRLTAGHFRRSRACAAGREPGRRYPLMLTTGRLKYHWHTMTRTGKNAALRQQRAGADIRDSIAAMRAAINIQDADFVEIISRRGKVMAQCRSHRRNRPGHMFSAVSLGPGRRLFQSGE